MANLEDMNITRDEFNKIEEAFQNDEFKKLFFEYCQEMQNPETKKLQEQEIIQLEAERGVDCKFVHPEPGFVVKTSVDGKTKGFINIASNKLVERPRHETKLNPQTGRKALSWQIPYIQGQPHNDYDNQNQRCFVYDVVFHPDAIHLGSRNKCFREHLVNTACDAVEREFKVTLDRTNLKYPKLKYKGISKPTVIRKLKSDKSKKFEPSPLDSYMPAMPQSEDTPKPKPVFLTQQKKPEDYKTPKYLIKHRRNVEYAEMTYHLDAKLNVAIPSDIIIEIDLPLLNSTADCNLDVTEKQLYLISEKPAKYQLKVQMPYKVNDKLGSATFDKMKKKLTVILPVSNDVRKQFKDLFREDSGVETDATDEMSSHKLVEVLSSNSIELLQNTENEDPNVVSFKDKNSESTKILDNNYIENLHPSRFLENAIQYKFPYQFDCNFEDGHLVYIFHVQNVEKDSIMYINTTKTVHLKFISIGSGFYPIHYSFYCQLECAKVTISNIVTQVEENNLIIKLFLEESDELIKVSTGLNSKELKMCNISDRSLSQTFKETLNEKVYPTKVEIKSNECGDGEVEINIKPCNELQQKMIGQPASKLHNEQIEEKVSGGIFKKRKNKKNNSRRSYSESECYVIKSDSLTEPKHKGILKRDSRYERSVSESYGSMDESYSYSMEPVDNIQEEKDNINLSESCKKTVRFSEVIHKQLFRLDSSILGQKKKNQKRKLKKLRRRNSESDTVDYDEKALSPKSPTSFELAEKKSKFFENNIQKNLKRYDSESDNDLNTKNNLMFELEM